MKELSIKQGRFVKAYLTGKSATASAIEAGYAPQSASQRGAKLLRDIEAVKAAVAAHRAEVKAATNYGAEQAMGQFDDAIKFAVETKNATAYARCIELKAKLCGLLDKDKDAGGSNFQINIVGLATPGSTR